MYPLKMSPEIKEILWGGSKMKEKYNKEYSFEKAGESWEVSTHNSGLCKIANGVLAGMTLKDAIAKHADICGTADYDLPLMFKIIDANNDLSIQVHPDDDYAQKNENSIRGKTEMWYVVDCDEGSRIGYGFNRDLSDDEIRTAIKNGTLENDVRYIDVKKGEAYFIPAGTVHCLCSGLLIAEIQQSSNVTYRLYDYNRRGADGKLRELHVEKALDVINRDNTLPIVAFDDGSEIVELVKCDKFICDKINCLHEFQDSSISGYQILFFTEGSGEICYQEKSEIFTAGDTFIIPVSLGKYTVCGECSYLRCHE